MKLKLKPVEGERGIFTTTIHSKRIVIAAAAERGRLWRQILVSVRDLREMPGFTSELYIETHDGAGVSVERFIMPGIYDSNEAAVQSAFLAGRHKI